ncbi:MAG: hypothetical protein NW223_20405 [Hyphomicrobiaceae bacterium]|nr:hypothetical protein [Hyphomicrobiaceae bacterium]
MEALAYPGHGWHGGCARARARARARKRGRSFSVDVGRAAGNAPDQEFVEPLVWRVGPRRVKVYLWIDEAVPSADVAEIGAPCKAR